MIVNRGSKVIESLSRDLRVRCESMNSWLYIGAELVTNINDVKIATKMTLSWSTIVVVDILRILSDSFDIWFEVQLIA